MKKSQKKIVFIGLGILVMLILVVWYYNRKSTGTTTEGSTTAVGSTNSASIARINSSMNWIKNNPEWNAEIVRKYPINGYTYNQQLAEDAIGSLISSGELPADYAGNDLHQFVKANY